MSLLDHKAKKAVLDEVLHHAKKEMAKQLLGKKKAQEMEDESKEDPAEEASETPEEEQAEANEEDNKFDKKNGDEPSHDEEDLPDEEDDEDMKGKPFDLEMLRKMAAKKKKKE